jgi:GAF domain-containing protein
MDVMPAGLDAAHVFARIAHELAAQPDVKTTTRRVVGLAKTVLACDSAAVWELAGDDRIRLHAATDPTLASQFRDTILEVHEGIAWECLRSHTTIRVADIRTDHRWPVYREMVLGQDEPFLSGVGFCLDIEERSMGALVLSSRTANFFTDDVIDVAAMFAEHAAIGIQAVTAVEKVENLELALASNRRIGIAVGILMAAYRLQEQGAFDLLRAASQNRHEKVRDVAEEVILTGTLSNWPTRRPA